MAESNTKLVIGLGNPGSRYQITRHNVGQLFIDSVKEKAEGVTLAKTTVYMNDSGVSVKKILSAFHGLPSTLYIVHDDLDLPLGKYKIQFGVGPKVHNGLDSVERQLGTKDFWHVRIGVDARDPEHRVSGEQYVLQDFSKDERKILDELFPKIWEEICNH